MEILEKIKNKYGLLLAFILIGLGYLVFFVSGSLKDDSKIEMGLNSKTYQIEVVDTNAKKTKGLSDRESLCEECGMLFVYEKPGIYNFWMKDMNFPIDIIWLNESKEIVFIKEDLSPDTFPNSFGTNLKSQYVLEFNAGFAEEHGLKFGDRIDF